MEEWRNTVSIPGNIAISSASYERTKKITEKGTEEQKNELRAADIRDIGNYFRFWPLFGEVMFTL
jgi:hypothetical protein